jgi:hypothetical protein
MVAQAKMPPEHARIGGQPWVCLSPKAVLDAVKDKAPDWDTAYADPELGAADLDSIPAFLRDGEGQDGDNSAIEDILEALESYVDEFNEFQEAASDFVEDVVEGAGDLLEDAVEGAGDFLGDLLK